MHQHLFLIPFGPLESKLTSPACIQTTVACVRGLLQDMLEKAAKNELPEEAPDELSNLLIDRDTCKSLGHPFLRGIKRTPLLS